MSTPVVAASKERVRRFWDRQPCGAKLAHSPEGSPAFFQEVERRRYEQEPFIPGYAQFEATAGRNVLEIGTGLGTDLVRFARAGARVTGVDLSEHSAALVRERLSQEGLEGTVLVADAEHLPFDAGSFDVVWSWGVLHHTPDTPRALREAIRVAQPGGRVCVMLYARRSWVAYGLWARYGLLRGRPTRSLSDILAHHMESEGTKGYTRRELKVMFAGLEDLQIEQVATPYDARVAGPVARWTGGSLGWFTVIRGTAPRLGRFRRLSR